MMDRTVSGVDAGVQVDRRGARVDSPTGTTEIAEFFGPGPERMFGCRYLPRIEQRGSLVIVPSVHAEHVNAYRLEVLLARAIARSGVAVQRFHYRGSGHSDGDSSRMTFDSMVEDVLAAAGRLADETGGGPPAFLGTRVGALVAAAAAARSHGMPVVLWEPVIDADRYFRDAFRARMIRDMSKKSALPTSESRSRLQVIVDELTTVGVVDVLGYPIDRAFYESMRGRKLVDELGDRPRTILLCQVGRTSKPRGDYERALARWRDGGFDVRVELIHQDEISWLQADVRKQQEKQLPLIDVTAGWLAEWARSGHR